MSLPDVSDTDAAAHPSFLHRMEESGSNLRYSPSGDVIGQLSGKITLPGQRSHCSIVQWLTSLCVQVYAYAICVDFLFPSEGALVLQRTLCHCRLWGFAGISVFHQDPERRLIYEQGANAVCVRGQRHAG